MNYRALKILMMAAGMSCVAPALHAQIVPGAQSKVTLSLTVSYTVERSPKFVGANTVYSGKMVKESYGNKQLITEMRDNGDLPDNTITGWQLVLVNRNPGFDEDEAIGRAFYLVKKGQTPVLVPYLAMEELPGFAESFSDTVNSNDEIITGKTTAFRGQFRLAGYTPLDQAEFSMVGVLSGSDKTGMVKIANQPFHFIYQIVSAKLSGLVGSVDDAEDPDGDDLLLEGSVSFSAETPVDISGYPAPFSDD
jgi:hypothetical protein